MNHCVLVIDDSKLARMAVSAALGRLRPGWAVAEAADAEQGRAAVAAGGVDIVLIDFNMPGDDGLVLARELRSRHPRLPIAILTANIQDEIIRQAREVDAGFVPKPLSDPDLDAFLSGATLRLRRTG